MSYTMFYGFLTVIAVSTAITSRIDRFQVSSLVLLMVWSLCNIAWTFLSNPVPVYLILYLCAGIYALVGVRCNFTRTLAVLYLLMAGFQLIRMATGFNLGLWTNVCFALACLTVFVGSGRAIYLQRSGKWLDTVTGKSWYEQQEQPNAGVHQQGY